MRKSFVGAACILAMATSMPAPMSAQTIDTFTGNNDIFFSLIGGGGIAGQSFTTAGAFTSLDDFSLWVASTTTAVTSYRAFVYAFNGSRLEGSALFASAVHTATGSIPTQVTFETGGILLTPGSLYMALIQNENQAGLHVGFMSGDTYTGGQAYGATRAADGNPILPSYHPFQVVTGNDFAFAANFSDPSPTTVPEPVTMALLGSGLAGIAGAARRRKRRTEKESASPR